MLPIFRTGTAAALLLLAALPGQRSAVDFARLQGLGDVRYHRIESARTPTPHHVFVRLPESYGEQRDTRYPTVYLLDGGITFPLLSSYYRYLMLAQEIPEAILVGIGYGTDDFESGNNRGHDYTAPAADREHYGGAADFQAMLREELLPLIEGSYRSDPARRIVIGQSLGGQFVLFTALTDPDLFWGHIASNPALHRNLELFLPDGALRATGAGSRLFMGSGTEDDPVFRQPALEWIEAWGAESERPWRLEARSLVGHSHFSPLPEAFRQGMRWLFESP